MEKSQYEVKYFSETSKKCAKYEHSLVKNILIENWKSTQLILAYF
jgi:hypothetical protein